MAENIANHRDVYTSPDCCARTLGSTRRGINFAFLLIEILAYTRQGTQFLRVQERLKSFYSLL